MIINLIIKINFKKEQRSFDRSTVIFMLRSQKLAWNGDYQKWSPTRHKGVSEPTNAGLLLLYKSHADVKYKHFLLKV